MARPNQYPENPHLPGTMLAAHWDFAESCRRLRRAGRSAIEENAGLRRLDAGPRARRLDLPRLHEAGGTMNEHVDDLRRTLLDATIKDEASATAYRHILEALEEGVESLRDESDVRADFARLATILRTKLDEWENANGP